MQTAIHGFSLKGFGRDTIACRSLKPLDECQPMAEGRSLTAARTMPDPPFISRQHGEGCASERTVALVAPHFPPSNLAAVHRARLFDSTCANSAGRPSSSLLTGATTKWRLDWGLVDRCRPRTRYHPHAGRADPARAPGWRHRHPRAAVAPLPRCAGCGASGASTSCTSPCRCSIPPRSASFSTGGSRCPLASTT